MVLTVNDTLERIIRVVWNTTGASTRIRHTFVLKTQYSTFWRLFFFFESVKYVYFDI